MNKNPIINAIVLWFSHTSNWTLLGGVVLGIVAAVAPTWAGQEKLVAIGNQLALLIPLACAIIAAAQKYADAKSQGETSAMNQWIRVKDADEVGALEGAYEAGYADALEDEGDGEDDE